MGSDSSKGTEPFPLQPMSRVSNKPYLHRNQRHDKVMVTSPDELGSLGTLNHRRFPKTAGAARPTASLLPLSIMPVHAFEVVEIFACCMSSWATFIGALATSRTVA